VKDNSIADFIALTAILAAIVSGSINFSQWQEIKRLSSISTEQQIRLETMERTLLMNRR
jgi:hypothetical protein